MTEEKDVVTHRSTLVPGGLSGSWKSVRPLLSFRGHHPFSLQADLVPGARRVCLRVCLCRKCSVAWDPFLPQADVQVSELLFFMHFHRYRLDKPQHLLLVRFLFLCLPFCMQNTDRNEFVVNIIEKLETIEN